MRCDGVPNVGEDVACRLSDGRAYRCRVVERRLARTPPIASTRADARADANGSAGAAAYEYYVHPRGLNRRLDEWVMDCRLLDASALHAHGDQAAHSASAPPRARAGPSGAHADAPSQPSTRVQLSPALTTRKMKRRIDVLNNVSASELDFDPRDEEQHEQETKVCRAARMRPPPPSPTPPPAPARRRIAHGTARQACSDGTPRQCGPARAARAAPCAPDSPLRMARVSYPSGEAHSPSRDGPV